MLHNPGKRLVFDQLFFIFHLRIRLRKFCLYQLAFQLFYLLCPLLTNNKNISV